jgi:hypothetical protein
MGMQPRPGTGTLSYLDAGGEQTVFEATIARPIVIWGVFLDLNALTQNGTVKVYHKIDGSNYREIDSYAVAAGDTNLYIDTIFALNYDFKVTYTEAVDEGAARDIPYSYVEGSM